MVDGQDEYPKMQISVDLPDELRDLLAELCRDEDASSEQLARRLLLDRLENFEDARIAMERMNVRMRSGFRSMPSCASMACWTRRGSD